MTESEILSEELYCTHCDAELTFTANQMQESLGCYSFILVIHGRLTLTYNGQELMLLPGDLYTYAPGLAISILDASKDYQGISLIADEVLTFEMPFIRNMIRAAYFPIVELGEPKLSLTPAAANRVESLMNQIIDYLKSDHLFKTESLRTLYTLFLLDLMNIQERSIAKHHNSERTVNLFINFIRLLPQHFIAHHNVAFYASELCISPTYLSRIVHQITGRTVVDYINQMLLMEASWLLLNTDLSIADIAEHLHFANQSSFSKFFTRSKGVNPKTYRVR